MSADPLADLLTEMTAELYASPYVLPQEAEWLRANRDRVLEALGGRPRTWETLSADTTALTYDHHGNVTGTMVDVVTDAPGVFFVPMSVWLFPEGLGE